jgi:hypothetical protein
MIIPLDSIFFLSSLAAMKKRQIICRGILKQPTATLRSRETRFINDTYVIKGASTYYYSMSYILISLIEVFSKVVAAKLILMKK